MKRIYLALLAVLLLSGLSAAQESIPQVKVQFAKGTSSKTIKATLKGRQTIDYVVRAAAGQVMKVSMKTSNGANYFNVIPPGETDVAIAIGQTNGNNYEGTLPSSGDYKIRVYLMRSAARVNQVANYTLTIGVTGKVQATSNASASTKTSNDTIDRAAQGKFNATGPVTCAQHAGQPMGQCDMGVARASGGTATVVVKLPDGRKRMIFFTNGKATGSDWSQADGGNGKFSVTKEGDLYKITVSNERYEIPEAVVFGG
jgi:hypothetical protein